MDTRICTRCGKGDLPPRYRYHDACLTSAAVTGSTPVATGVEAVRWYDDETSSWRWSETVWMDAACGATVYTADAHGNEHLDCGQDGCVLTRLSAEQAMVREQTDWNAVDTSRAMPGGPSTFEAGFPEVYFRPRGKTVDPDDEDFVAEISRDRRQMLEQMAEYEWWLPAEAFDAAVRTGAAVTDDLTKRAEVALAAVEAAMDLEHELVA